MVRPSSFLGNCHGEDFWEPQHGQSRSVGRICGAIGHIIAVDFPSQFADYEKIMKSACPGTSQRRHRTETHSFVATQHRSRISPAAWGTDALTFHFYSGWYLGEWLQPIAWTLDQAENLLQNTVRLEALCGVLSPLFPAVQVPDECGGVVIGVHLDSD